MNSKSYKKIVPIVCAIGVILFAFNNCSKGTSESGSTDSASLAQTATGCYLADQSLRSPKTMDDVTKLINALPKPLTIPCLIENLPAPLKVFSMQSSFSAQPSQSADTPRVFIVINKMVLSVVPTGSGRNLLEMSQIYDSTLSVKTEVSFPVTSSILASAPYERIRSGSGTSCRSCHTSELQVSGFAGTAFASTTLRPDSNRRIPVTDSQSAARSCNMASDPDRCKMMRAIFITGNAQDTTFP